MNNSRLVLILKLGVLATWFLGAAGFLLPSSSSLGQAGRGLFFLLLAVHAVECAVFHRTLQRTGRPLGLEIAQTLFFGVIHYAEAKVLADAAEDAPRGAE